MILQMDKMLAVYELIITISVMLQASGALIRPLSADAFDDCATILPEWPGASIPGSSWPSLSGTPRGARSAKCGGECACESGATNLLLVDCSRAETPNILTQSLGLSTPPQEVRLVIMGSELTALHSLGNNSVTRAHFKYNPGLSYIADEALKPSKDSLLVLDLRNNNLSNPLEMSFKFKQLQFLSLDDNSLESVPQWVSGTRSLVHLSLANNRISDLAVDALHNLPNLQFLNLHKNLLSTPPGNMQLTQLRSLVLQDNPITRLPPGMRV